MDNVTILIKTFNRPSCLKRLLKSIDQFYGSIPIVIVDDSEKKYRLNPEKLKSNITYLAIDEFIGVCRGRNLGLEYIKTKYFIYCDDDFVFDKYTDLKKSFDLMISNDVRLLAGHVRNFRPIHNFIDYPIYWIQACLNKLSLFHGLDANYFGNISVAKDVVIFDLCTTEFPYFTFCDIAMQFFIAETEDIKNVGGWNESVGIGPEHIEFFYRLKKNNVKVAYTKCLSAQHRPQRLKGYIEFRNNSNQGEKEFIRQAGIKGYKVVKNGEIVVEY